MKKLIIALVLLVISIPAWPIQKDYEQQSVTIKSYDWVQINTLRSPKSIYYRVTDATQVTFVSGERKLIKGFVSIMIDGLHVSEAFIVSTDTDELLCLDMEVCYVIWEREVPK